MPPKKSTTASRKKEKKEEEEAELKWANELREFLYDFILDFIDDEAFVASLLTADLMPIWMKAFTHITFNVEDNYEQLEYLGDRQLEGAMAVLLVERLGKDFEDYNITEIKNFVLSKLTQAHRSQNYGFDKYLRISTLITTNISSYEDVYESFVGALFTTSAMSKRGSMGIGFESVYRFLKYDLKDVNLRLTVYETNPQSWFLNHVSEFVDPEHRIPKDQLEVWEREGDTYTLSIKYPPEFGERARMILRKNRISFGLLDNLLELKVTASSKVDTQKRFYREAARRMRNMFITREGKDVLEDRNAELWFNSIERRHPDEYDAMMQKIRKEGYSGLTFKSPPAGARKGERIYFLVGTNKKRKKEILGSAISSVPPEGRLAAVRDYISK